MVNGKSLVVLAAFALVLLSGCLISKTEADCAPAMVGGQVENASRGNPAICYHEVAVSYAMRGDTGKAVQMCGMVGGPQWLSMASRSEMNNCYSDIAIILKNQTICDRIETGFVEDINEFFGVWMAYQKQCVEKAAPPPPGASFEFCRAAAVPLVLPLIALLAAAYRR